MIQCPSCGMQIRSDARFCISCGAPASLGNQPANMFPSQNVGGTQTVGEGRQSPVMLPAVPTYMQEQSTNFAPPVQAGRGGGTSTGRKVFWTVASVLVVIILAVVVFAAFSHQSPTTTPSAPVPTVAPPHFTPPSISPPGITPPNITPPVIPPPPFSKVGIGTRHGSAQGTIPTGQGRSL